MGRGIRERYLNMLCRVNPSPRQCPPLSTWKQLRRRTSASTAALLLLILFLLLVGLIFTAWIDAFQSLYSGTSHLAVFASKRAPKKTQLPVCTKGQNFTRTCPKTRPTAPIASLMSSKNECPPYFKWIHEDLRPWNTSGISRDMVERARKTAHFRLVIIDGRVYVKKYRQAIQTRDVFTIWGILQLLRRYPGRLPDLELMFDCGDRPVIHARDHQRPKTRPPPLFRYCGDDNTLDIVFPDWSFWGWAETNIKPWTQVLKDIEEGNHRIKWDDRMPYAYWKGNPNVAPTRKDLLKCNVTDKSDWNARLYVQDWDQESKRGYKHSNLENQCAHRYKIYIDGWAWSVSKKYIMACDSMTLLVKPKYYEFFIRGMLPLKHYWPIRDDTKCTSLKFAVEWGNNHTREARSIAEAGSGFMLNNLRMDYVYDYMFHLLNEYAKLLRFKPAIPSGAVEICKEKMVCPADGKYSQYMMESMVDSPSDQAPCSLPAPFDPPSLQAFNEKKAHSIRQVEMWENDYCKKKF